MKATELRIGDWVTFANPTKGKTDNGRIKSITEANCMVVSEGAFLVSLGHISPIPLTEEMLEKIEDVDVRKSMGGALRVGIPVRDTSDDRLILDAEEDGWAVSIGCETSKIGLMRTILEAHAYLRKIHYVHELQHLLWALGIEKEVEV